MGVERTITFVDLAGFTALTEAHGDAEAIATIKAFRDRAERALGPADRFVKTIGDAVMLAFPTPQGAVEALARLFDAELRSGGGLLLPRAGAHHGEVLADGGDYFGQTVNLAARVAAQAAGGQLLVTSGVALAARDLGFVVTHLGAVPLRNIAEPVDLYEIDIGLAQQDVAIDVVCAMRVPTSGPNVVHLRWDGHDLWFCGLPCVARFASEPQAFLRRWSAPTDDASAC